jgi:hypothetical protein
VPSGIWQQNEYDKLPLYDGEISDQALAGAFGLFMCHQKDGHLCAGWLAAHGPQNLLAIRMAGVHRDELHPYVYDYETDIPVFSSGAEARAHGMKEIQEPGPKAHRLMDKLLEKGLGRTGEPEELE